MADITSTINTQLSKLPRDNSSSITVDNISEIIYNLNKARDICDRALSQLENCTYFAQNEPSADSRTEAQLPEGESSMAQIHRQRVMVGVDADGTPLYKWVQGKTINELNKSIVQAYIDYGLIESPGFKTVPVQRETLFRTYAERWLELYKVPKLRETTLQGYKSNLRKHIYPALGDKKLSEITTDDLQTFLTDRKYMAKNTLHTMLVLISEILASAVEDKLIPSNPADSKRLTIPTDKKTEREALPHEHILDILANTGKLLDDERRLIALLLFTGMRRGEVLGLRWEDIDFEKRLIHVQRAVSYTTNQPIMGGPKTKSGVRSIPLDEHLVRLLSPIGQSGFIIGGEKPVTQMVFRRLYRNVTQQVDLHGATPHIFRHSYLSMLSLAGVDPKTIQTIGGHADITTTMNRYVHSEPSLIQSAGQKVSNLFRDNRSFAEQ